VHLGVAFDRPTKPASAVISSNRSPARGALPEALDLGLSPERSDKVPER
jgi:hypothetical protein